MIRRIRPVSRTIRLEAEIKRLGDEVFSPRRDLPGLDQVWIPSVDVYEKENEIVIEIEVPEVLKKDIKIMLLGNRLEVKGMKKEQSVHEGVRYHRLEREYGAFRRTVFLPCAVIPEETLASLENGILKVVLRKSPRRSREVEVKIKKNDE